MDLIVGSRAESLDDVRHTLTDLLTLENPPPHISCYALTPEPGTPLGRDPAAPPRRGRDRRRVRPRGRGPRRARAICGRRSRTGRSPATSAATTTSTGTTATTWASVRPRTRTDTAGASGTCARPIATSNSSRRGDSPLGGEEIVDEASQRFERDSLALRTARGVPLEAFDSLDEIAHLVQVSDGRVTLTPKARLVANQVIVRLKSAG